MKLSDKASTAEAQAGTNDTKWMTPLKTKQAIASDKETVKTTDGTLRKLSIQPIVAWDQAADSFTTHMPSRSWVNLKDYLICAGEFQTGSSTYGSSIIILEKESMHMQVVGVSSGKYASIIKVISYNENQIVYAISSSYADPANGGTFYLATVTGTGLVKNKTLSFSPPLYSKIVCGTNYLAALSSTISNYSGTVTDVVCCSIDSNTSTTFTINQKLSPNSSGANSSYALVHLFSDRYLVYYNRNAYCRVDLTNGSSTVGIFGSIGGLTNIVDDPVFNKTYALGETVSSGTVTNYIIRLDGYGTTAAKVTTIPSSFTSAGTFRLFNPEFHDIIYERGILSYTEDAAVTTRVVSNFAIDLPVGSYGFSVRFSNTAVGVLCPVHILYDRAFSSFQYIQTAPLQQSSSFSFNTAASIGGGVVAADQSGDQLTLYISAYFRNTSAFSGYYTLFKAKTSSFPYVSS